MPPHKKKRKYISKGGPAPWPPQEDGDMPVRPPHKRERRGDACAAPAQMRIKDGEMFILPRQFEKFMDEAYAPPKVKMMMDEVYAPPI